MVKDTIDTDKLKKGGCGLPLYSQHIDHERFCKDEEQYHTRKNNEGAGLYHLPVTPLHPLGIISGLGEQRIGYFLNDRNQILAGQPLYVLCLGIEAQCGSSKKLPDNQLVNVTINRIQQPRKQKFISKSEQVFERLFIKSKMDSGRLLNP